MNTLRIFFCGVILLCTATATDAATRGGTDVCGTSDLIFADAFEFELIFQDNFELDFCIVAMDTLGAAAEQAFAHQVRTIPSEAQVVSYSITKGPPGLSIDANGLLQWNPTLANLGLHSINIRAVDQTAVY